MIGGKLMYLQYLFESQLDCFLSGIKKQSQEARSSFQDLKFVSDPVLLDGSCSVTFQSNFLAARQILKLMSRSDIPPPLGDIPEATRSVLICQQFTNHHEFSLLWKGQQNKKLEMS